MKQLLGPPRSNCKFGYIRRRKYSYTKKSGIKVNVKSSCIPEQGIKGAGYNRSRKLKVIPLLHKGSLEGYSTKKPIKARHSSLKRSLRKHGFSSTIKKLNVLNVYNKYKNPKLSHLVQKDMNYVRKFSNNNKRILRFQK